MSTHPTGGERIRPGDPLPDEETGQFGDAEDAGLESDEDLDGEQDADGGEPLHRDSRVDETDSDAAE